MQSAYSNNKNSGDLNMLLRTLSSIDRNQVVELFKQVFTDAHGADAGLALKQLVRQLVDASMTADVMGYGALDDEKLSGAIFFSRLKFDDPHQVYMLSPVAVSTARQKRGLGQRVIRHGLEQLRSHGADLVVTYGDPAYYGRFGFEPLSQVQIRAPHPLTMPDGWLGLALNDQPVPSIAGTPSCVAAFNDQSLW